MNDVGDRADDYERRVTLAGGSDTLIGSLIEGADRMRLVVRWLVVALISIVVGIVIITSLLFIAWNNAENVERNGKQIQTQANRIDELTRLVCERANLNSIAVNDFLNLIIDSYESGDAEAISPAEIKRQIEKYEGMKVRPLICKDKE